MSSKSVQVLRLYRAFLRTVGRFEHKPIKAKLKYNIRDIFEVYQQETDPVKIDALVAAGRRDLQTLQRLSEWDEETWKLGGGAEGEKATPSGLIGRIVKLFH